MESDLPYIRRGRLLQSHVVVERTEITAGSSGGWSDCSIGAHKETIYLLTRPSLKYASSFSSKWVDDQNLLGLNRLYIWLTHSY